MLRYSNEDNVNRSFLSATTLTVVLNIVILALICSIITGSIRIPNDHSFDGIFSMQQNFHINNTLTSSSYTKPIRQALKESNELICIDNKLFRVAYYFFVYEHENKTWSNLIFIPTRKDCDTSTNQQILKDLFNTVLGEYRAMESYLSWYWDDKNE